MLKIKELNKKFKGNLVLNNLSFELNKGEILSIIGKSGAGKTTTLRCLNGLEKPDSGTIQLDNLFLCKTEDEKFSYAQKKELRIFRRRMGLVFQSFNLFPHMTVLENIIEAPIKVLNMDKIAATREALETLEIIELEDKKDAYPCELSGGQKQRAAIARALVLQPEYLCFDEPTSALDPELSKGISSIIKNLSSKDMGILIITHDMDLVRNTSDRVLFMDKGKITKESTINEFVV
ncbi:ATP-binding cassette domain-containing protein [Sporosalibacterium faouarense]|uniref:ATP-binding cassette domain-containing protein n=1 Tax=Sporosalibacterium faouarense TaxID=516123 RepID=UPI00192BE340